MRLVLSASPGAPIPLEPPDTSPSEVVDEEFPKITQLRTITLVAGLAADSDRTQTVADPIRVLVF